MAHTKAGGSTKNLRDSKPKYLGVKRQHDQKVEAGEVLIRQRGTKYVPGKNVKRGKDDTLYAAINGVVAFKRTKKKTFNGKSRYATTISIK